MDPLRFIGVRAGGSCSGSKFNITDTSILATHVGGNVSVHIPRALFNFLEFGLADRQAVCPLCANARFQRHARVARTGPDECEPRDGKLRALCWCEFNARVHVEHSDGRAAPRRPRGLLVVRRSLPRAELVGAAARCLACRHL